MSTLVVVLSFLFVVAFPGVEPRLQSLGSVVVTQGLTRPEARGIFLDQELNPCLLHWQADSLPLSGQGSPILRFKQTEPLTV